MTNPHTMPMLPRSVMARKLAGKAQRLAGTVAGDALSRLRAAVPGIQGPVRVVLDFVEGDEGTEIHGQVEARVELICQRCLGLMEVSLEATPALGLVRDEREMTQLPQRLDPCVLADEELDLFELVEEELLLALPIVAMHARECGPQLPEAPAVDKGAENPFRVLERLKPPR